MKRSSRLAPAALILMCLVTPKAIPADRKPPTVTSWAYVTAAQAEMMQHASHRGKPAFHLPHGALLPVYETKMHGAETWLKIQGAEVATLQAKPGWINAGSVQSLPAASFPTDSALLRLLGGGYLDEEAANTATLARFLLNPQATPAELVCFIYSRTLPTVLLQAFRVRDGKAVLGPSLSFAASGMDTAVTAVELKDLRGDGRPCLITHEVSSAGAPIGGVNLVVRALGENNWQTLWTAPLELRNLQQYPARIQVLSPPEKNIGAPGTVTKAEVTFQPLGKGFVPVWKGHVAFYVPGNEQPTQTIEVQKTFAWQDGCLEPFR
jgi:hypothetical protein